MHFIWICVTIIALFGIRGFLGKTAFGYILGYLLVIPGFLLFTCMANEYAPPSWFKDYAEEAIEEDPNAIRDMEALGYKLPPKGSEGNGNTYDRKAWYHLYVDMRNGDIDSENPCPSEYPDYIKPKTREAMEKLVRSRSLNKDVDEQGGYQFNDNEVSPELRKQIEEIRRSRSSSNESPSNESLKEERENGNSKSNFWFNLSGLNNRAQREQNRKQNVVNEQPQSRRNNEPNKLKLIKVIER